MDTRVELHSRGILFQISSGAQRAVVGQRLRAFIPRECVIPYANQFIVPARFAAVIAAAFSRDELSWSNSAWELVCQQRQLRNRSLLAQLEVAEALASPHTFLEDYSLLTHLDEHQVEAVAAMAVPSLVGLALFDEQGLGKTVMALCAYDRLRQHALVKHLLVVAPKSVLYSWRGEIVNLFKTKYRTVVAGGTGVPRRKQLLSAWDILLCNYDVVTSDLQVLARSVQAKSPCMLVVDESYYVKNAEAKRSKAVARIRSLCDRAIILCGTPAPNSPSDLLYQLHIAYDGIADPVEPVPEDKREAAQYVANALSQTIYLRRLKSQVFPDMPGKEVVKLYVELRGRQRELYDEARTKLVLKVKSVDEQEFIRNLGSFLAQRSALMQICSHPGAIEPLYNETPAKLEALDRLILRLVEQERQKVVIWSFYRYSLDVIALRYRHHGLVRIDGSIPALAARSEAIRRFQEDEDTMIFLGNAAAAGAGITLSAAHHAIYESFSNQAAHYMQSVDRIHRRGQTHDVTYHVVLADGTVEKREYERIQEKEQASHKLLGDFYVEPISREMFLKDLE